MFDDTGKRIKKAGPSTPDVSLPQQQAIVNAFFTAARAGDFDRLMELLDPDVVVLADGGPARPGASVVMRGAAQIARATIATAGYWLLLGAPLVALSAGIRQDSAAGLLTAGVLIVVVAWSMGQLGLWLGIGIESEFSRTLAHWGCLLLVFVGTLALPLPARAVNPVLGIAAAQHGMLPVAVYAAYLAVGLACDAGALLALRRYLT